MKSGTIYFHFNLLFVYFRAIQRKKAQPRQLASERVEHKVGWVYCVSLHTLGPPVRSGLIGWLGLGLYNLDSSGGIRHSTTNHGIASPLDLRERRRILLSYFMGIRVCMYIIIEL